MLFYFLRRNILEVFGDIFLNFFYFLLFLNLSWEISNLYVFILLKIILSFIFSGQDSISLFLNGLTLFEIIFIFFIILISFVFFSLIKMIFRLVNFFIFNTFLPFIKNFILKIFQFHICSLFTIKRMIAQFF